MSVDRQLRKKVWQVSAIAAYTLFIIAIANYRQAEHLRFVSEDSHNNNNNNNNSNNNNSKCKSQTTLHSVTNKRHQNFECATVHVATYCNDVSQTRDVVSMLHTILYHRTSPLQFHLIVDESSERTLRLLFDTWELPNVTVHFYAAKTQIPTDSKITTTTLVSLLQSVLPALITQVIYASSRMRFLDDITKLWHTLDESETWGVGVAPNTATYLDSFETDQYNLVVYNMALLRNTNVSSGILKQLPSSWSVFMDGHKQSNNSSRPQGVIWKDKFTGSAILESTRRRVLAILDSSGDLFRTAFVCGSRRVPRLGDDTTKECAEFTFAVKTKRRIHLNFLGGLPSSESSSDPYDISLATQFTVDRLSMLNKAASTWGGPIVAVVHASDSEARSLVTKIQQSKFLKSRKNIAYHVVYRRQFNPINFLRNVALNQTKTPYVVLLDVDFAPMPSSYSILKNRLRELSDAGKDKLIPVIPAFEAFESLTQLPKTKTELLQMIKEDKLDAFKVRKGWHYGHKRTDYPRWKVANESYVVTWRYPYEPYLVMPTRNILLYPEELLERMQDKIAYSLYLHAMGYDLLILHDVYILHFPHPPSPSTVVWGTYPGYASCGTAFFDAYKKHVKKLYPSRKT